MRYAIYLLLAFGLLASCKSSQNSHGTESMVIAMDSLDLAMVPDLKDHGITVTRLSATHAMVSYPKSSHGKIKFKNVGNDYSKVKDAGNIDIKDKSIVKDKSKAKPKVKDSIQGDGNSQQKSEGVPPLLIYLSIGGVFLIVLLFLGWPKIKRFFPF